MTLYRQLLLSTFLILFGLCSALWLGELNRTRDYLALQMETQVQESANFLGLTLSSVQGGSEQPIRETMIDALFDSGAYRLIELSNLEGRVLVSRINEEEAQPAPSWFCQWVELSIPQASAKIMRGWVQTGIVHIESRLDAAYLYLWRAAKNTALWCGLAWLIFAALGGVVLRSILHPLKKIEEQAIALCERQLDIQQHIPSTRELRRVVVAMNTMTTRISRMFSEHAAVADKLQHQVYRDPLTGLGNRRYLESQINARFADLVHPVWGTFLLIQLQGLKELNEQYGYDQGDRMLQDLATWLQECCRDFSDVVLARLGGGDVALFLPGADAHRVQSFWEAVITCKHRETTPGRDASPGSFFLACGGTHFEQQVPLPDLLAAADMALAKARSTGGQTLHILPMGTETGLSLQGRMHWKETILDLIGEKNIVFYAQPTVEKEDRNEVIAHEIYARVEDSSGNHISLALYIAVAEQFGLTADLEQMILEKLLQHPLEHIGSHRIALNISPSSLLDDAFYSWICQMLAQCNHRGLLFNIEFPESHLHFHGGRVEQFVEVARKTGHGIGIDHFGQGLTNFNYLQRLLPDYVKIDRAIADDLVRQDQDVRFFIDSLCAVAHSLGVKVIVKNVETDAQLRILSLLNIDAVQGNALQPPVLLGGKSNPAA